MESIKSRSKENNVYNFKENWSSKKKNNDVNEDLKYNEHYNAYETNNKEDSEQWLSEIYFIKKMKIILKLKNLTLSLPKWKENLEIILSKRKTYRKKK